jgi:hypothetical protein
MARVRLARPNGLWGFPHGRHHKADAGEYLSEASNILAVIKKALPLRWWLDRTALLLEPNSIAREAYR